MLTLVVKPLLACNARCRYCYGEAAHRGPRHAMGTDALDQLLRRVVAHAREGAPVRMLWHGGEPLLMGAPFYRRVLEHLRGAPLPRGAVSHSIQTNLTVLDGDLVSVLAELVGEGGVGTSVDPLPGVRTLPGGRSYLGRWYDGFRLLTDAGVRPGVVYVVHQGSLAEVASIYRFFRNLGPGMRGLRLNPAMDAPGTAEEEALSPTGYADFLRSFRARWEADDRPFRLQPVEDWEAPAGSAHASCAESGRCDGILAVDAALAVYPCGRLMNLGVPPLGSLADRSLAELLTTPRCPDPTARAHALTEGACAGCAHWLRCHGGCPAEALAATGDALAPTPFCEGRRLYLDGHTAGGAPG